MIVFLQGTLVDKQPTRVQLDVRDVGYELFIPLSSYDRLPSVGGACRLLVHDHLREDAHQLFGFVTEGERSLFEQLIGISGIGPKLALSALSGLSVREIKAAVIEGDVKRLSGIPGVGRKTAERMIVDLRDKITAGEALEAVAGPAESPDDARLRDAVLALIALGYKRETAHKQVLAAMHDGAAVSVEELVRKALGGG